jgi:SAM-dependent methyltransferase
MRGVDLNGASLEQLGLNPQLANQYADSRPDLALALSQMRIPESEAAIDMGCGKGGALIVFADHFERVTGVELSPILARTAEHNLVRVNRWAGVICCDAGDFVELDPYTVVFMYSPFPGAVLMRVLANLKASVSRVPRTVRLLYRNPVHEDLLLDAGFTRTRCFDGCEMLFCLYELVAENRGPS